MKYHRSQGVIKDATARLLLILALVGAHATDIYIHMLRELNRVGTHSGSADHASQPLFLLTLDTVNPRIRLISVNNLHPQRFGEVHIRQKTGLPLLWNDLANNVTDMEQHQALIWKRSNYRDGSAHHQD